MTGTITYITVVLIAAIVAVALIVPWPKRGEEPDIVDTFESLRSALRDRGAAVSYDSAAEGVSRVFSELPDDYTRLSHGSAFDLMSTDVVGLTATPSVEGPNWLMDGQAYGVYGLSYNH